MQLQTLCTKNRNYDDEHGRVTRIKSTQKENENSYLR